MKKNLLIFMFFLIGSGIKAQTPSWNWAQIYPGSISCTDDNGNVYITGSFDSSTVTFGSITLYNAGNKDIFLVKFNSAGNVLWAKHAGSTGYETPTTITCTPGGKIFIAGKYNSLSLSFGAHVINNSGGMCSGGWYSAPCMDIFLAKYDGNGNALWARSAGNVSRAESVKKIATDANGNVYLGGEGSSPMTFGSVTINLNTSYFIIYVAKYDGQGNAVWAKGAIAGNSYCYDLCTGSNNSVFITGYYSSSITFDGTTLNSQNGTIFIAKYNSSGTLAWAKSEGKNAFAYTRGIAADANGVYLTGHFTSNNLKFGNTTLTSCSSGCTNVFLVKYTNAGNLLWAKSASGTTYANGSDVTADINGNIYLTGAYKNSNVTFGGITLANSGGYDIYITKYNSGGSVIGATGIGGNLDDSPSQIECKPATNDIYLYASAVSPSISLGSITLTNSVSYIYFIAKANASTFRTGNETLKESAAPEGVIVYPNPSDGNINIESAETIDEIKVLTGMGQLVYEAKLNETDFSLQLDEAGIYFVRLTTADKIETKKIVVTK